MISKFTTSPKVLTYFIAAYIATGVVSLVFISLNWYAVLAFFLMIAFGNGTVAHRYFSHNSFKVAKLVHWLLALWATLAAYTPLSYWITQHRHHHKYADQNVDIHSPVNGMFRSFILWIFDAKAIASIFTDRLSVVNMARSLKDPATRFFSNNFLVVNLVFLSALAFIDMQLIYAITAAYVLEQIRLGLVNMVLHLPGWPGNYVNHELTNKSQNNYVLGLISLGFGWHNNHHANASKLILTERWWELDIEGYLGWILSKTAKQHD